MYFPFSWKSSFSDSWLNTTAYKLGKPEDLHMYIDKMQAIENVEL